MGSLAAATTVMWFRRDLRLGDNPALLAAREAAGRQGRVVPLVVLDDRLRGPAGAPRLAALYGSLRALDAAIADRGGRLVLRTGDPATAVAELAREVAATEVHVAADFGPYGRVRDAAVEAVLARESRSLVRTGSPYAVAPGRLTTNGGTPFPVYSPYARAWRAHGWREPAPTPRVVPWARDVPSEPVPADPPLDGVRLPPCGEAAALARWRAFREEHLPGYAERRNLPAVDGTSGLSMHLKYGTIHPRTLLAGLGRSAGEVAFAGELAWRDFYADMLWHRPDSARDYLRPALAAMRYDRGPTADARYAAWCEGRTGYPFVDAAMRQLRTEAWQHNRARMVVASFLVKDLHLEWTVGARHFLRALRDGDLASNSHGWQWVAGSGTDPAPYFRIFNPVSQGQRFDPDGDYVRRYVAELRGVPGAAVHTPWALPGGLPAGYPPRIVDHAAERAAALERYRAATDG